MNKQSCYEIKWLIVINKVNHSYSIIIYIIVYISHREDANFMFSLSKSYKTISILTQHKLGIHSQLCKKFRMKNQA